jgi:hypothetical protein
MYQLSDEDKELLKFVPGSEFPTMHENEVPITVPSIKGQRWLDKKNAIKLLKPDEKRGGRLIRRNGKTIAVQPQEGFDRGQYRPIFLMAVPLAEAEWWVKQQENPSKFDGAFDHGVKGYEDYALFLYDGQTRTWMLEETMSTEGKVLKFHPGAIIYKVNMVQDGNKLFSDFNHYQLRKTTAENNFICDTLAGFEDALDLERKLKDAKFVVTDKEDFFVIPEDRIYDKSWPRINIKSWKVVTESAPMSSPRWTTIRKATDFIRAFFQIAMTRKSNFKHRPTTPGWLLAGLTKLFEVRPDIVDNPDTREAFLSVLVNNYYEQENESVDAMMKLIWRDATDQGATLSIDPQAKGNFATWAMALANAFNKHGKKYTEGDHSIIRDVIRPGNNGKTLRKDLVLLSASETEEV